MDRISLYGKMDKWTNFVELLKNYKTDEDFFAEYNVLKDKAINFIKASDAFNSLNNESSKCFEAKTFNLPDRDAYKEINVGKKFISIDMVKANFTSLVYYAHKNNKDFYKDFDYAGFLSQFTDKDYFVDSKCIRQVIFGNCNCKRIISYEKVMMSNLLDEMLNKGILLLDNVYSLRADEILIDTTYLNTQKINNILDFFKNDIGFPVEIEIYVIKKFKNEDIYIKEFEDKTFEIKKADIEDMPAVCRYMQNLPESDLDLYFFHNGRIAKFDSRKEFVLM